MASKRKTGDLIYHNCQWCVNVIDSYSYIQIGYSACVQVFTDTLNALIRIQEKEREFVRQKDIVIRLS